MIKKTIQQMQEQEHASHFQGASPHSVRSIAGRSAGILRWGLIVASLAGLWVSSPAEGRGGECVSRCNQQYLATIRQCDAVLSQNGRRDWHADCVKNAGRFRMDCLRTCR